MYTYVSLSGFTGLLVLLWSSRKLGRSRKVAVERRIWVGRADDGSDLLTSLSSDLFFVCFNFLSRLFVFFVVICYDAPSSSVEMSEGLVTMAQCLLLSDLTAAEGRGSFALGVD